MHDQILPAMTVTDAPTVHELHPLRDAPAVPEPRLQRRELGRAGRAAGTRGPGPVAARRPGEAGASPTPAGRHPLAGPLHFAPKAKQVIYLHMVGGPPQMDMYDYKPSMDEWYDKDLPDSIRHGPAADDHDLGPEAVPDRSVEVQVRPARQVRHVGLRAACRTRRGWSTTCASSAACTPRRSTTSRRSRTCRPATRSPAGPCLGAWASYGLGSLNDNLPTFVVLVAKPTNTEQLQAISARLWSSGYLSGEHAGVSFRSGGDPILYINNPAGVSAAGAPRYARRAQGLERDELSARGRPRDAHPHRAVRAGLPHAGRAFPS